MSCRSVFLLRLRVSVCTAVQCATTRDLEYLGCGLVPCPCSRLRLPDYCTVVPCLPVAIRSHKRVECSCSLDEGEYSFHLAQCLTSEVAGMHSGVRGPLCSTILQAASTSSGALAQDKSRARLDSEHSARRASGSSALAACARAARGFPSSRKECPPQGPHASVSLVLPTGEALRLPPVRALGLHLQRIELSTMKQRGID